MIGNGKRKTDKLITVGIAQSVTKLQPNSKEWKDLSQAQILIGDESHLMPADTLEAICSGIAANAPYRFFLSATQLRNDGSDLLLEGIIGQIVLEKSLKELVDLKYLAKPNFIIIRSKSNSTYTSSDSLRMLNKHLYNNPIVHQTAAQLANQAVSLLNHQVLISIDHVEQFQYLLPHLKHQVAFAHGGVTKANKTSVPERFHKSDPNKLVKAFNAGEIPILVGTSCISMGTDIKPVKSIFCLQGGKSKVKFMQLIGRGTRLVPGKTDFNFVDFMIENVETLKRHTFERYKIYQEAYENIKWL